MKSYFERVKNFILELELTILHESEEDGILVVSKQSVGISNLVLGVADPILIFEQFLFEIESPKESIFQQLLQKNRDMVHGAFVLDGTGSKVIYRDTLELENLDLNEVEGTINALSLLLSEYTDEIIKFSKQ